MAGEESLCPKEFRVVSTTPRRLAVSAGFPFSILYATAPRPDALPAEYRAPSLCACVKTCQHT